MDFRRAAASLCVAAMVFSLAGCGGSSSASSPRTYPALVSLVQQRVKHVFVIVQENHTFDNYFGLYPGTAGQTVENLASATAQADDCVPDPEAGACQRPFLITTNKTNTTHYVAAAPDITGGSNSRFGQQYAIDGGKMDGFLNENETSNPATAMATPLPANPTPAQVAAHNNALNIMTTYDCDTVPYLWYYAKNFALFDHYFQANTGQSTPGNVQLFAAQMGQTEVAAGKEPYGISMLSGTGYTTGLPLGNDDNPPPSQLPFITPYTGTPQQAISVASVPVLLNPSEDTAAAASGVEGLIPDDIALEAKSGRTSTPWAWYQEGSLTGDGANIAAYSSHHDAPLYFDYVNNAKSAFGTTTTMRDDTYANAGLLTDIKNGVLPAQGVFWVKGAANQSTFPFKPADTFTNPTYYTGDDDHPGNTSSDHQVAEAYVATLVNAIAASKYWQDSVILITWDDSGGMYDHYPPGKFGNTCPDDKSGTFAGTPCGEGVRLPMLVISPFAKNGAVVHDMSDSGSVSKFIEDVFALPTLASLPDEAPGVSAGVAPSDANAMIGDLTGALDYAKLNNGIGNSPTLATIPSPASPPSMSCSTLGLTPIQSPAAPPPGFETQGYYYLANPNAAANASIMRSIPTVDDSDD